MRSYSLIFTIGLLCATAFPAAADPEPVMNREWWSTQNQISRDAVVGALIEGFNGGFVSGYFVGPDKTGKLSDYDAYRSFSHSIHFYESAIDDFYATYPNAEKTTIGTILICNADKTVATCDDLGKEK